MSEFRVVIPARFASQRLPGKPLLSIGGKPMVQHVYERANESGAQQVVVATDDDRIADAVRDFGGEVCMTSATHTSGTDRIAEVVGRLDWPEETLVVNLQGDEPLIPPGLLAQVADTLSTHALAPMATLAVPLSDTYQLFDTNTVKVVVDRDGYALYFSRATIPWKRDQFNRPQEARADWLTGVLRHLGIYAYRAGFLAGYAQLPVAPIEQFESLEQLRVLWNGGRIAVEQVSEAPPAGVDTHEDLERIIANLS